MLEKHTEKSSHIRGRELLKELHQDGRTQGADIAPRATGTVSTITGHSKIKNSTHKKEKILSKDCQ